MPNSRLIPIALSLLATGAPLIRPCQAVEEREVRATFDATLSQPTSAREERLSALFERTPYSLGSLGEGPGAPYDQGPLHRFDEFDCTTFVETVLALSLSRDWEAFPETLRRIRYRNGRVDFIQRNHITELDWLPNNERAGTLRDITRRLAPGLVTQVVSTVDKGAWFSKLGLNRIRVPGLSQKEKLERLKTLREAGSGLKPVQLTLDYLPIDLLVNTPEGRQALDRIPSGAVINIVRPNWNQEGTQLNISHQGLAIRSGGVLLLRHASLGRGVVDIPLHAYLAQYVGDPSIKGINVNAVVPANVKGEE